MYNVQLDPLYVQLTAEIKIGQTYSYREYVSNSTRNPRKKRNKAPKL